jgi:mRNA-degrading endonuclease toxin of MazEF toxin-antitoxin module
MRRGDVILTYVRFTSGPGGKVRPALIVQSDHNNQRLHDTIIAIITRTTHRAPIEPTQLLIDVSTPEGESSGFLQNSAVKCEHLETILQADIQRTIGHLSTILMQKVILV